MANVEGVESAAWTKLQAAYSKVDAYQPVFKFEGSFRSRAVSRGCEDRCEFLYKELGDDTPNLRILDVGCSMGYLSLFFAEKGASVTGLDFHEPNIDFCRTLSEITGIRASFTRAKFSMEYCRTVERGDYNVVFLFSVLHHVVSEFGLRTTQDMMADLLDKADVIYVELARRSEDVKFAWKDKLPENELDIFSGIPNLDVCLLGEFPALGETTIRPLYRVRKKTKRFGRIEHRDFEVQYSAIRDGRTRDRKYYVTDGLFTKCFIFSRQNMETFNRFSREACAYNFLGRHRNVLPVHGIEVAGRTATITFPKLTGKPLSLLLHERDLPLRETALSLLSLLVAFDSVGLFWNDLRAHNIAFYGKTLVGFDFETANAIELENTRSLFLWLLWDLASRKPRSAEHNIFQHKLLDVPVPPLKAEEYPEELRDIALIALEAADTRTFLRKSAQRICLPQ
jgi:SAM-dependent methyltransferase